MWGNIGQLVHFSDISCNHVFRIITLSTSTNSPALISRGIRLLMNQLSHKIPLSKPMILIVSLSRASFSYTTLFRMMATEYIHARVMKSGMERLITRKKLRLVKQGEVRKNSQTLN